MQPGRKAPDDRKGGACCEDGPCEQECELIDGGEHALPIAAEHTPLQASVHWIVEVRPRQVKIRRYIADQTKLLGFTRDIGGVA